MSSEKKPPIIKKIIKKGHGGHHGGSWKVAYADFVTAMMAFFLVMWLLAISSEQGKAALAEYYENLTMSEAVFNGGMPSAFDPSNPSPGILTGGCYDLKNQGQILEEKEKALEEREKALNDRRDERPDAGAAVPTDRPQNPDLTTLPEGEAGEGSKNTGVAPGSGLTTQEGVQPGMGLDAQPEQARQAKAQLAADMLSSVNEAMGGDVGGQFFIEQVPGGLKLQISDQEGRPLFLSGQSRLTPLAMNILSSIAERLTTIPNKIAIEGHTDAKTTSSQELTNWELSTARASQTRIYLHRHGVKDDRLTMVAGYAATQPLPSTNPLDSINRRISIMIWDADNKDEAKTPVTTKPVPATPTAPASPPATTPSTPSTPPAAGEPATNPPVNIRPTPPKPTAEDWEKIMIDETLHKAATVDASTAGPPVANTQEPEE